MPGGDHSRRLALFLPYLTCDFIRLADPRGRACRRHRSAPAREGTAHQSGRPCARGRSLLPANGRGTFSPLARTYPSVTGTEIQSTEHARPGQSERKTWSSPVPGLVLPPGPGSRTICACRAGSCGNHVVIAVVINKPPARL